MPPTPRGQVSGTCAAACIVFSVKPVNTSFSGSRHAPFDTMATRRALAQLSQRITPYAAARTLSGSPRVVSAMLPCIVRCFSVGARIHTKPLPPRAVWLPLPPLGRCQLLLERLNR